MVETSKYKNTSGYSIQTAIAIILFILGLMLLVIWAILYSNRLSNNLTPEWWIWFFLGFGVALMIIGLIWLIIMQYVIGNAAHEIYEDLCRYKKDESEELKSALTRETSSIRKKPSESGSFAHNS